MSGSLDRRALLWLVKGQRASGVVSRDHWEGRRRGPAVSAFFSFLSRDGFRYFHTQLCWESWASESARGGTKGWLVFGDLRGGLKGDKDRLQNAFAYLALRGSSRGDAGALPFGSRCDLIFVLCLVVIQSYRTAN